MPDSYIETLHLNNNSHSSRPLNNTYPAETTNQIISLLTNSESKEDNNKYIRDLTHLKTYTIDDEETSEIDDAISLERFDNKYKIWIHIACPSFYINLGSSLDLEARKRSSSLYLAEKYITMFPEEFIQEVVSIIPGKIVIAISVGVVLNDDGSILDFEV